VTELTPKNPRVVITGVSRGIGRATALAYASMGGRVAGLHRGSDPGITEELNAEIRARGGESLIRVGDIKSTFDIDALADAAAAAWGGNPDKDATYLNITPAKNDGSTVYRLNVKDVPVDAFWSVSVYNADGYFEKNPYNAYTINNLTAQKSADGAIAIQFGGCDGTVLNCLPVVKGWNYTVRLYRPRAEILNGKWKLPGPQPVG